MAKLYHPAVLRVIDPDMSTWPRCRRLVRGLRRGRGPGRMARPLVGRLRGGQRRRRHHFAFADGSAAGGGVPQFTLAAPAAIWAKFLAPVPPRHHHAIFAMLARVPEFAVRGDQLAFLQHCHVVRRVLEVGKWLALGHADAGARLAASATRHPHAGARRDRRLRAGDRRRHDLPCLP